MRKWRPNWLLLGLALTTVYLFAAGYSAAQVTINIGIVEPRTGSLARLGETTLQGALLAIEDVNRAGGIKALGGAKLNAVVADAKDATAARSETERLITRNKVSALLGCYSSSFTLVATEVSERYQVPFLTNSIADEILGRGFKNVFRMSVRSSVFGLTPIDALVAMTAETGKPVRKVAIIYEDTSYGTSTSKSFYDRAKEKGLDVVLFEAYRAGLTDAAPLVNKIKASGAEAVFPVSYLTDAVLIIRTMKEMNVNAAILGGGSGYLMPDSKQVLGDDLNYIFTTACWNHDLPYEPVADINARYEAKHGEFIQETAGEMYAAIWVIKDALERCASTDPKKLRDAIAKTDLTAGPGAILPGGRTRFDETGQVIDIFPILLQWQDGRLRTVWPKSVATTRPIWPVPNWKDR